MNFQQVIRKYGKDFMTEWYHFNDGAIGCITSTIAEDVEPKTGWSICSAQDAVNFDPIKGEAIALLRAQSDEIGFDNMFRSIPDRYYKTMILKIFGVKPI